MRGYEIIKELLDRKAKSLSVSSLFSYTRDGLISFPLEGAPNSIQSEYPETAAGEAYAVRELLPIVGPSMFRLAREIGLHILAAAYQNEWDIMTDAAILKLIKNRTDAAFYAAAWLEKFYDFEGITAVVSINKLRVALLTAATPDDIEQRRAEWNAKDIAAINERTALRDRLEEAERSIKEEKKSEK